MQALKVRLLVALAAAHAAGCLLTTRCIDPDAENTNKEGHCRYADGGTDAMDLDAGDARAPDGDACNPRAGGEVCDGVVDEDCDDSVDEGCDCEDGAVRLCEGTEEGPCVRAHQTCADGEWQPCEGGIDPVAERCNAVDDDCDGSVDEDPQASEACDDTDDCTYDICSSARCFNVTIDEDADGQSPSTAGSCGTDCDDSDPLVFAGQTEWFTEPSASGMWDYNCDSAVELRWADRVGGCTDTFCEQGWNRTDVACGETASLYSGSYLRDGNCICSIYLMPQMCR